MSLNPKCVSLNPKRFSNHKNLGAAVPFKGIALLVALWIGLDSVPGTQVQLFGLMRGRIGLKSIIVCKNNLVLFFKTYVDVIQQTIFGSDPPQDQTQKSSLFKSGHPGLIRQRFGSILYFNTHFV